VDHVSFTGVAATGGEEDQDSEEHAEDGDGEADISDCLQVVTVPVQLTNKLLVDIEDEGKIGQVGAGTLGVGTVVTDCTATKG